MTSDVVGAGTIKRLGELRTGASPTLSMYLDLEAEPLSTPADRDAQLQSLTDEPELAGGRVEIERVRELLGADPELTRSPRGLAVFSCSEAGILEAVGLPGRVEPLVVLDTMVWLEPLADLVAFGNRGVAVLNASSARLFRGGASALTEFAAVERASGDHSPRLDPNSRPVDRHGHPWVTHITRAAAQLLRAHHRRPFDQLVIVADDQLWRMIDASLDPELKHVLAGVVHADLQRASASEIMHIVTPVVEGVERARERALIASLEHRLQLDGTAVCGLQETLATLQQQRVETLLIADGALLTAGKCPECGRLTTGRGRCELDAMGLDSIDAIAQAVNLAQDQAATVVRVRHERDALIERGSIAALTRAQTRPSARNQRPTTQEASNGWSTDQMGALRRARRAAHPV
jgi:hypothetical protein